MGGDSILDQRSDQTWWGQPRGYVQGNFTHLNKLNEYNELVVGGSFMKDQGYRFGSDDQRTRINAGWKHFSKKYNGLSYGLNLNNNFNKNTLALYKVKSKSLFEERHIQNIIKNSHAKIVTVSPEFFVIEKTGFREETEKLYKDLAPYGLLQFVRSGRISVTKEPLNITEILNEK